MKFRELIIESIMDPGVIHKELKAIVLSTSELVQALLFISTLLVFRLGIFSAIPLVSEGDLLAGSGLGSIEAAILA